MKALKSFSIPSINFGRNKGQEIKKGQLKPELQKKLIKSGHISKPEKD